jgi:hypothetical protein
MPKLITDPDAFPRIFSTATSSAFRLEVRRAYGVTEEDEPFRRFLAGEDPGIDWFRPWLDLVRETTGRGVRVERVRVIDEPPSDYLRFEIAMTPENLAAGEDIRYLTRREAHDLGLPPVDYWLVDAKRLYVLHFSEDDRFLGLEEVKDQGLINEYGMHRIRAWTRTTPFTRGAPIGDRAHGLSS